MEASAWTLGAPLRGAGDAQTGIEGLKNLLGYVNRTAGPARCDDRLTNARCHPGRALIRRPWCHPRCRLSSMLPFLPAAREECPSHTRWHLSCALVAQDLAEGFGHIARQLEHYSTPLPPLASPVPPGSTAVGFPTLVTCYCVPYRHCAPSR